MTAISRSYPSVEPTRWPVLASTEFHHASIALSIVVAELLMVSVGYCCAKAAKRDESRIVGWSWWPCSNNTIPRFWPLEILVVDVRLAVPSCPGWSSFVFGFVFRLNMVYKVPVEC
jgi:hypothetical protein